MEQPEVPLEQTQEDLVHHAHGSSEKWGLGVALGEAAWQAKPKRGIFCNWR